MRHAAIAFGRELERRMPDHVTTKWWKEERGEKVFIDYNQNARDRTIASPYSHPRQAGRARVGAAHCGTRCPTSRPRTSRWRPCPRASPRWATASPRSTTCTHSLEPLLEMYERDEEGDMPYPPDYPKMPGEPKRVQPSRDRDRKKG